MNIRKTEKQSFKKPSCKKKRFDTVIYIYMSEQRVDIEKTPNTDGFYATITGGKGELLAAGIATGFRLPPELIVIGYFGTNEEFNKAYEEYLASQQQDKNQPSA